MSVSKHFKHIVRIVVWGLIGFHIGLVILFNIPAVQGKLAALASSELRKILNTEVSVGHVELGLFNRIHIENVLLNDLHGKELLKVNRLSARFELTPLIKGKIIINSIQLIGFKAHLNKETPESQPNFQFVLDAFASKDTLKKSPNLDLRINSVLINHGNLTYDVLSEPETPDRFNASHIGIQNLSASIALKTLRKDSLNATIRRLGFEEKSGFKLDKLSMKVLADNRHLSLTDFSLQLPNTVLNMNQTEVSYDSLQNLPRMTEDVSFSGKVNATFLLADLSPILPVCKDFTAPLDFSMSFQGKGKDVEVSQLSLSNPQYIRLSGKASAIGWDKGNEMYLNADLSELSVTQTGLRYIMTSLTGSVPSVLEQMKFVQAMGELKGYANALHTRGTVRSAAGLLTTHVLIGKDKNGNRTYSGTLSSSSLHIGNLLNDTKFGQASFNIAFNGFNYRNQYPESYIKGTISSFDYSNYRYENIHLDGIYKEGGFNGHLALDDTNGKINIDGFFNTAKRIPQFNLQATVRNFRPHELNLSDKYEDADLSLNLNADFIGRSLDDLNGHILIDSLTLNAPAGQEYFLDSLTIAADNVNDRKELRINSSFMNALIQGDYSYATIPASILQTIGRYVPSLLTLKNKANQRPHNNFRFDIQVTDTELFKKLFYIPIEMHMPSTLRGYFNDHDEKLRIEGFLPRLTYNGTLYESASVLCENPSDRFTCQLRGSMLMNSGAMLNLSLVTHAEQDCLKTTLDWGNNTDVTYGGQVSAKARFFKTEGKSPILQADIDILPTKVILNDTIWDIRSSHVAIDSGRIYIDNFLFERPGQHLRIDGKITQHPADSCLIELNNIDVQYVLNIVQFDDVEFGGLATGKVMLKNIMDKPDMKTNLRVHNFSVNKGLMGEADIKGFWDNELPGIRLDAQMEEKDISTTHVTGFVSPKLKALDLNIDANNTNLDLLVPYFEGIFSEWDGRATGLVRLHGGFKTLDFEGGVRASLDTKVDILNTYLQLHNDSVYISAGEFALKNARIFDREGHSGLISGSLRHTHLKNLMYQFSIDGNNLLLYNTNDPGDMLFYGKVYGTGHIQLNGGNNAMNVEANITTGPNTTFTYVTGLTTEATSNQFITFVDKTPRRIQDSIKTELYHHSDAQKKKEEEGPSMDIRINMLIDATPDAYMKVIMDPVAGDNITARGNGNFRVSFYNKGDFNMYGNYIIDQGMYKLSMQEIIRKDFTLNSGSMVTFTGDPYQANLDVQAVYTVNSVSLSDLSTDASLNQSTVKVNCLMNLTGSLASPTIKFDLELPTVNEEDRELVRSATSTEEQMNTQIIYLLGIGKFYAYDYAGNTNQSSNATSSLAFSTLSGQLNNMLSQVMENKNWNFGANLSTGQQGWSDVEAEAILSGRLLNNRLLINGNFGYRENALANTNFVGDFEAVWLLTKDGEFRLRGYNQTNDRYFTKSTLTTQGIGFIYKKDFNLWNELFHRFMHKRNLRKNKEDKENK